MFQMSSLVSFQTPGLKGEANTKCPKPIFFFLAGHQGAIVMVAKKI